MNENQKKFDFKLLLIALLAIFGFIFFFKLQGCESELSNLERDLAYLRSDIRNMQNQIAAIYTNVDERLQKQASLLSGYELRRGTLDEQNRVALDISVTPKELTEDMTLSVELDGEHFLLERVENRFVGKAYIGLFAEYDTKPLVSIYTGDILRTEYLEKTNLSHLFEIYLPSVNADMTGISDYTNGRLAVDLDFSIDLVNISPQSNVVFNSFFLVEELNGNETSRTDITNDISFDKNYYHTRYRKKIEMSKSDKMNIYLVAVDSLGYTHKTNVYCYQNSENRVETIFGGERIYDQDGNLLFG